MTTASITAVISARAALASKIISVRELLADSALALYRVPQGTVYTARYEDGISISTVLRDGIEEPHTVPKISVCTVSC